LEKQREQLSQPVIERLLTSLADAYLAVKPECRGDFWRALLAICDTISSGQVSGKMVLSVDFSLRMSPSGNGVRVDQLRIDSILPDLRTEYEDLVKAQEDYWKSQSGGIESC